MRNGENQRIRLTKRLLHEALVRLLEKSTIQKISVTQLCEEAGINRATFYRHYGSPADVLREMELDLIDGLQETMGEGYTGESSSFRRQAGLVCDYLWKHSQEAKLFFGNTGLSSDFAVKLFRYIEWQSALDRYSDDSLSEAQKKLVGAFWQIGFLA